MTMLVPAMVADADDEDANHHGDGLYEPVQGALDLNLPALHEKFDCMASSSQLLLLADGAMYLFSYPESKWRRIPPCTSPDPANAEGAVTINTLGCSFHARLDETFIFDQLL
ncbi:hypothetical protein L7F22_009463, partial [Adiantum nelumboides]|nr:hypothetical protein [Adiantum nelumboides]